jgi:signal transduction histidine kinase
MMMTPFVLRPSKERTARKWLSHRSWFDMLTTNGSRFTGYSTFQLKPMRPALRHPHPAPYPQRRFCALFASACLLLVLFAGLIGPSSAAITTLGADQHKRVLGPAEVSWLRDPTGGLTIEQIVAADHQARFQPLAKGMNFGFTRDAIWLRITLARSAETPRDWRLELNVPYMNDVRFYTATPNGFSVDQAGDRFPFVERPLLYRNPLFPMVLTDEAPHAYYLRIETDSVTGGQLVLWHLDDFRAAAQDELALIGGVFGTVLMLGLLSLVGWLVTRDRQFIHYVALAAVGLLTLAATNGLLAQQVLPTLPHLADRAVPYSLALYLFLVLYIQRRPLDIPARHPRLDHVLRILMLSALLAPLTRELDMYHVFGGPALRISFAVGLPILIWVAWQQWRSGMDGARFVFAGLLIYFVTTLTTALVDANLLPIYSVLQHAWQGGLVTYLILAQVSVLTKIHATRRQQFETEHATQRMRALAGQEHRLRQEQTRFFSFVVQELQTPLQAIRTGLSNLGHDLGTDNNAGDDNHGQITARFARLERSTERIAGMIERHLQLQRLTDPGFALRQLAESPLVPVIGAIAQVAELYPEREISHHVAGELPTTLSMDAELMELCLVNLLTNAGKYSPADSPIYVEIRVDSECRSLEYRVIDSGPGILPDEQDRLFRIYQRRPADPARQAGFGIGLTLAARIAKLHGGSLGYRRVNQLSVFVLELGLPAP